MKVVRILTYEGDSEWIKETLKYSLPDGQFKNLMVETVEYPVEFPPLEYGNKHLGWGSVDKIRS
jgi:hypothetical protein